MKHRFIVAGLIAGCTALTICGWGCTSSDYLDPTQIGRFKPTPVVNTILPTLGVAEEETAVFEGAEEPRPVDVIPLEDDYRLGAGDVIRVSIFELLTEGQMFVNDYVISETGKISIPEVGQVTASGLTEAELENEIRQVLSPSILREPSVTVILQSSQRRTFAILGEGVPRPSRYELPRYPFRLTDALALAGSPSQFNVSYIYVTRALTGREGLSGPAAESLEAIPREPTEAKPPTPATPEMPAGEPGDIEKEMMELLRPSAGIAEELIINSSEMAAVNNSAVDTRSQAGAEQKGITEQQPASQTPIEWIFKDGRWVPIRPEGAPGLEEPGIEREAVPELPEHIDREIPAEYGLEQVGGAGIERRVIKIPVDKLLGGDPRYDVVIRPGDTITVPVDVIGEAWITGNVNRVGAINITGRPLTLKMAMAAAGGLGPLAWPTRVEVIRRISEDREEIVMVDLDKIARGVQPDFFIKPHDLINVGTHPSARYLAVLRNAFRATYGFGFVYDRNFVTTRSGRIRLLYE